MNSKDLKTANSKRVNRIIRALKLIGRDGYEIGLDEKDVKKIFKVIRKEVRVSEARCKSNIARSKQDKFEL